MLNILRWFEEWQFIQPLYFNFLGLIGIMLLSLAGVMVLKLYFRPPRTKYSRYQLWGQDLRWIAVIIIGLLSVIALAGPQISSGYSLSQGGSVDVLVFADNSFSMRADDLKPSRQEAAKEVMLMLADKSILRPGDRVTLFVFGGVARWRMPLSEDLENFKAKAVEINQPEIYNEDFHLDTNFPYLLEYVVRCLDKQDGFAGGNRERFNLKTYANNRLALMFSDGNNESSSKLDRGLRELNKRNIKVYSIGVGTRLGSRVSVRAYDISNPNGKPVRVTITTKVEPSSLEKIARATNGEFFLFDAESERLRLERFIRSAVDANRTALPRLVRSGQERNIWWEVLALPAIALIMLAIWLA